MHFAAAFCPLCNTADGLAVTTKYYYDTANRPSKSYLNSYVDHQYVYDTLGRLNYTTLNFKSDATVKLDYTYANAANRSADDVTYITSQISKEEIGDRGYAYTYDKVGNITKITEKKTASGSYGNKVTYTYDALGQLTRENNVDLNKTIVYTYDAGGNIASKRIYAYTTTDDLGVTRKRYLYYYDSTWKDKLTSIATSVNSVETTQEITYDAVGNPTNYMDNVLTWTMGRQLASFGSNTYTYNEDGIRTSKTVNGVKTTFLLDGYNVIEQTDGITTLHFFYDSNNEVIGFIYNGNDYFYVKNAMNDIIAIIDSNKNIVAEYRYDPWGDILSTSGDMVIGELNPFRYRSYYYYSDIELYYLQSRYYDAEVGRFINCDDVI